MNPHAYELGCKLATSRWREAIRSGELPYASAEKLKARMGVDPSAWADKLTAGAQQRAKNLGYRFNTYEPQSLGQIVRKNILKPKALGSELTGRGLSMVGGGGVTVPKWKRIDLLHPTQGKSPFYPEPVRLKSAPKQLLALLGQHESQEAATAAARPGLRYTPLSREGFEDLGPTYRGLSEYNNGVADVFKMSPATRAARQSAMLGNVGAFSGAHLGAMPPLTDIREARMLSPTVQRQWAHVRARTGELQNMLKATNYDKMQFVRGIPGGMPYLPRKQLPAIARRMERAGVEDLAKALAEQPVPEIAQRAAGAIRWGGGKVQALLDMFRGLRKLLPR